MNTEWQCKNGKFTMTLLFFEFQGLNSSMGEKVEYIGSQSAVDSTMGLFINIKKGETILK